MAGRMGGAEAIPINAQPAMGFAALNPFYNLRVLGASMVNISACEHGARGAMEGFE
jgi:hypothetical protein